MTCVVCLSTQLHGEKRRLRTATVQWWKSSVKADLFYVFCRHYVCIL